MTSRNLGSRVTLAFAFALVAGLVAAGDAHAQGNAVVRVWQVPLGTPASKLPPEFMITACGSNGGPPSTPLQGFHEFGRCRAEPETGLREVWFSYDDEYEYALRAARAPVNQIQPNRANVLFGQLVLFSLLFDSEGRVQGYRIISDPREEPQARMEADMLEALKVFAFTPEGWTCTDLPRLAGEEPFGGVYIKKLCEKVDAGRYITMEVRRLLKPGQMADRGGAPGANEFDVGVRTEVIAADIAGKAAPR